MNSSRSITFSGATVHYSMLGSGPALMLVHGFGEDSRIWNYLAEKLCAEHRIILPDIPGSGRSAMIKQKDTAIDDYAECIRLILEEERISNCVMLGHSMGGYITLAFAEKYPQQLRAFGLIHSTCHADDEMKIATRKKSIEFIRTHGSGEYLAASLPGLFFDPERNKKEIAVLEENGADMEPDALIQYQEAMIMRPARKHVLEKSQVPVFFQIGRHDKAVLFDASMAQCHLPAVSELQILRNVAHMGMLEDPEQALQGIGRFLTNLDITQ